MAIAAPLSAYETAKQVENRFAGKYLEARLINAPGVTYTPNVTNDTSFLASEVTLGTAGYARQIIKYELGDVSAYGDDGVGLATKTTIFAHDGSGTTLDFTHVALVWSHENVETLGVVTAAPSSGVNGTYTNIPIDVTNGSGTGLTVDVTVTNSGAATTDYAITVHNAGLGYAASDTLSILNANLVSAGITTAGTGDLTFSVGTASSNGDHGYIFSVAQTTNAVALVSGREAIFYWDLKQYNIAQV